MKKTFQKIFGNAISMVIGLYCMVAVFVFTPYYNWNYAQTHGFIEWVMFGEIVPTAKAFAWPYFAFFAPSGGYLSHVSNAINYANKSTAIANRGGGYQQVSQSDIDAIIGHDKKAVEEAEKADIKAMNRDYKGFGDHFRDEFIQGLKLSIKSLETGDAMLTITSQAMLDRWGNWYTANVDNIRHNRNAETAPSEAQNLWWLPEYTDFIKFVSKAPNKTLETSYKSGPKGEQNMVLIVSLQSKQKLVLTMELPKEATGTIDEKTGKKTPHSVGSVIIIRDNNLDGMLNDFKIEPGQPPKGAILTKDGFIRFTGSEEDKSIYMSWVIGIGYCINHYLHGIDSFYPK